MLWKFTNLQYAVIRAFEMSVPDFQILDFIRHQQAYPYSDNGWCSLSAKEIGSSLMISEATVNRTIKDMASAGLLEKHPQLGQLRRVLAPFILACDLAKDGGQFEVYQNDRGSISVEQVYQNDRGGVYQNDRATPRKEGVEVCQNDRGINNIGYSSNLKTSVKEAHNTNAPAEGLENENQNIVSAEPMPHQLSGSIVWGNLGESYMDQNFIQIVFEIGTRYIVAESVFMDYLKNKHPMHYSGWVKNHHIDKYFSEFIKANNGRELNGRDHLDRAIAKYCEKATVKAERQAQNAKAVPTRKSTSATVTSTEREQSTSRFNLDKK